MEAHNLKLNLTNTLRHPCCVFPPHVTSLFLGDTTTLASPNSRTLFST
uniref:Uncharacterized protein n=1 Tax=Anguilla anguilla TaxID=7936 RepID=A0A0E9XHN9_ANGAN